MWIATTINQARTQRRQLTGSVALVPTMGALHEGHLTLIRRAQALADHVVVSIFINPTQFGPHEDFTHYPRSLDQDLEGCKSAGAAGVFCPTTEQMYPPSQHVCKIELPTLTDTLEGVCRPGHFEGVCWIVAKLFNIIEPDTACFGRKDFQQLRVIEAMVNSLAMPIHVVGLSTVREGDGLALSSRNIYLNPAQRRRALALSKALRQAKALVEDNGETDSSVVEAAMRQVLTANDLTTDYAVVRHPKTLAKLDCIEPSLSSGVVALIAAWVDQVRLIDNMILAPAER